MTFSSAKKEKIQGDLVANREIVIATMHSKEKVIAPLLESKLKLRCSVPDINTDLLGTFTGEVERELSPLETLRKKCKLALEISGLDIAVASEGSFGAHPFFSFVQADEELVMLYDQKNDLEIVGKELTTETNFDGTMTSSYSKSISFARKVGFPRHALIIRKDKNSKDVFYKGINTVDQFKVKLNKLLEEHSQVWLETDMRAMHNPTRMKAIERATLNLIEKYVSKCPSCNFPGYWIKNIISGLPCSLCGAPTKSTLAYEYGCENCGHQSKKHFPHAKKVEDPMYCDFCNP